MKGNEGEFIFLASNHEEEKVYKSPSVSTRPGAGAEIWAVVGAADQADCSGLASLRVWSLSRACSLYNTWEPPGFRTCMYGIRNESKKSKFTFHLIQ